MSRAAPRMGRIFITVAVVVLLYLFARGVDWGATWQAIRHASPALLGAAAAVNLLSAVARGARWWIFLRPVGATSLALALKGSIAGAGLNNVLPANGGEAARVIFVARATRLPSSTVLATLALERLFDPFCFVLILALTALVLPLPPQLARARVPAAIALLPLAALMVFLMRASKRARQPRRGPAADAPSGGPRPSFVGRARRYGSRFVESVAALSTPPRFAGALVLSIAAWLLQVATFDLAARSAGVPLPLGGTIGALLATNLGLILRATPGNVGFFQVAYALVAAYFGVQKDAAIGVAFLIQTIQILPVTALGVLLAPEFVFGRGRAALTPPEPSPRAEAAPEGDDRSPRPSPREA